MVSRALVRLTPCNTIDIGPLKHRTLRLAVFTDYPCVRRSIGRDGVTIDVQRLAVWKGEGGFREATPGQGEHAQSGQNRSSCRATARPAGGWRPLMVKNPGRT
jgi:hypothetical protein